MKQAPTEFDARIAALKKPTRFEQAMSALDDAEREAVRKAIEGGVIPAAHIATVLSDMSGVKVSETTLQRIRAKGHE